MCPNLLESSFLCIRNEVHVSAEVKARPAQYQESPSVGGEGGEIPPEVPVPPVTRKAVQASFLEVFCGYGGLTRALQQAGWKSLGIDYALNKDKPIGSSVYIDLSTISGQEAFWC